jgi:hypothetical protein
MNMANSVYNPNTRIFENDFMESMTRTHPVWPALFWIPSVVAMSWYAFSVGMTVPLYAGLFVVGMFAWTLMEYALHRWAMHYVPPIRAIRKYYYIVHQAHHDATEFDRLVAPVPIALSVAFPTLAVLWLVLGQVMMWPFFAGFVVGYLAYDYIHLYTHFGKPTSRVFKILRRRHMQHHTLHNRWFGVSTPLWDYVFRTHVRPGERVRPDESSNVDWDRRISGGVPNEG